MTTTQTELEVTPRQLLGKGLKALRRQGIIPANVYGHGLQSQAVQLPSAALLELLGAIDRTTIVSLRVAGDAEPRPVFIRSVQRHPSTDALLHVDFQQISLTEKIRLVVPVLLVGEAPAVKNRAAILLQSLSSLLVEALPNAVPAHIEVDVTTLIEIDDAVHLRDLQLPSDVVVHADPETLLVKAAAPAVEREVVAAEEKEAEAKEAAAKAAEADEGEK